jgi:hypothetical protein
MKKGENEDDFGGPDLGNQDTTYLGREIDCKIDNFTFVYTFKLYYMKLRNRSN